MSADWIIKQTFMGLLGICGGSMVAAGLYAFITILGLVPRLAARTHTASQIRRYENWIILGSVLGNGVDLFDLPLPGGFPLLILWGSCSGIFVGCLVMSLAETLDTLPTMSHRLRLSVGIPYVITGIGLGKLIGSFYYFIYEIAA